MRFTTVYQGQSYGGSFLDTGSNAVYFLDSRTTGLTLCPDTADFYCPASPQSLSATHRGVNGTTGSVAFGVANADMLLGNLSFSVFSLLAGPNPGSFDWGLPFFFGRNVFTAIESQSTPMGFGPYWASRRRATFRDQSGLTVPTISPCMPRWFTWGSQRTSREHQATGGSSG